MRVFFFFSNAQNKKQIADLFTAIIRDILPVQNTADFKSHMKKLKNPLNQNLDMEIPELNVFPPFLLLDSPLHRTKTSLRNIFSRFFDLCKTFS